MLKRLRTAHPILYCILAEVLFLGSLFLSSLVPVSYTHLAPCQLSGKQQIAASSNSSPNPSGMVLARFRMYSLSLIHI